MGVRKGLRACLHVWVPACMHVFMHVCVSVCGA